MQPHDPSYKPKSTIIPATPGLRTPDGANIVAWVIEDGRLVRAICYDPTQRLEYSVQRGADE